MDCFILTSAAKKRIPPRGISAEGACGFATGYMSPGLFVTMHCLSAPVITDAWMLRHHRCRRDGASCMHRGESRFLHFTAQGNRPERLPGKTRRDRILPL